MTECCPTCQRPFKKEPKPVRFCAGCKKPIAKHHKWQFVTTDNVTMLRHRNCNDPCSYTPALPHKTEGGE